MVFNNPVVLSGTTRTISSGETSNTLVVLRGATVDVLSGGITNSTALQGTEILLGGSDSAGVASSGATQIVSAGGMADNVVINAGAWQTVSAGGLASGTLVRGVATVLSGGLVMGGVLYSTETISAGRSVSATIASGGDLTVSGITSATNTGSGLVNTVLATGVAVSTLVNAGGFVGLETGGFTSGTVLAGAIVSGGAGAMEVIFDGLADGTIVNSGAEEYIGGGSTSGTVVLSGGVQSMHHATALNDAVAAGGRVIVDGPGMLAYAEAGSAASRFIGTLSGTGTLAQSGPGTLVLAGVLDAFSGAAVISGGTLELSSATAGGRATIGFAPGAGGTLRIDGASGPANTISGFNAGDVIDLAGLGFTGNVTPTVGGSAVTITEGTATETLTVAGASNLTFQAFSDGAGGTDVAVACYCLGTLILTDRGECSVEALAIGDCVVTISGAVEPIRWLGRRSYAGRFLAGKAHLLPIRIRAGALGGGLPMRDLLVSPSHAMFIDNLLIPAAQLLNGTSVVQERHCTAVSYIHIELAAHGVIFAEGAPSETYLDDDNRGMFHNAAEFAALYGADAAPGRYCAPRMEDGFALEVVRRRLAERVAA